jgi:hypothetical protein
MYNWFATLDMGHICIRSTYFFQFLRGVKVGIEVLWYR